MKRMRALILVAALVGAVLGGCTAQDWDNAANGFMQGAAAAWQRDAPRRRSHQYGTPEYWMRQQTEMMQEKADREATDRIINPRWS